MIPCVRLCGIVMSAGEGKFQSCVPTPCRVLGVLVMSQGPARYTGAFCGIDVVARPGRMCSLVQRLLDPVVKVCMFVPYRVIQLFPSCTAADISHVIRRPKCHKMPLVPRPPRNLPRNLPRNQYHGTSCSGTCRGTPRYLPEHLGTCRGTPRTSSCRGTPQTRCWYSCT